MSGSVILLVSLAVFLIAYIFYGSRLAKKWGVDPVRKTAAYEYQDGKDYSPTDVRILFGHHLVSTSGSAPITGAILSAVFGWVPVLLWILFGSVFIGGIQNFISLLISSRTGGRSLGVMLEKKLGKSARLLYTGFGWLTIVLVIAAFSDFTANIFCGYSETGREVLSQGAVTTAALLSIPLALLIGWLYFRRTASLGLVSLIGIFGIALSFWAGLRFPLYFDKAWCLAAVAVYIFVTSQLPIWILQQPRDYLTSFLIYALCVIGIGGVLVANPTIYLPPVTTFTAGGTALFPGMFLLVGGGAVSGYHSLVSGSMTSKQLSNERDAKRVGYGGMLVGALMAVLALIAVGSLYGSGMPTGSPFEIFSSAIAHFLTKLGLPSAASNAAVLLLLSLLSLAFLDTAARLGRYFFQSFFHRANEEKWELRGARRVLNHPLVAGVVTVGVGTLLSLIGYDTLWPLLTTVSAVMAVLALLAASLWLKDEGRPIWSCFWPMLVMLVITLTGLFASFISNLIELFRGTTAAGTVLFRIAVVAAFLALLGMLGYTGLQSLFDGQRITVQLGGLWTKTAGGVQRLIGGAGKKAAASDAESADADAGEAEAPEETPRADAEQADMPGTPDGGAADPEDKTPRG